MYETLEFPSNCPTAVTAASAHTSVCQWRTLAGAAAKQQRMMLEASKGMIRGQGRERRRRNAIQEMRVKIVSSAGEEEVEVEAVSGAMQANAGRSEHAWWWKCLRGRKSCRSPSPWAKRLISKQRSKAAFACGEYYIE